LLWAGGESAIFAVDPRYLGNPVFVNEISEECGGLSAMDNFCAAAEDSGRICVYRDSECVAEYQAHDNLCGGIKMVKDDEGMCVLSGGFDSKIVLWDPLQQAVIQEISVQSQQSFNPPFVHSVEMCLEADTAVAALGDGSILLWIWDDEEEDTLLRIPAHRAAISHIHFAHWGNQYELISLGNDKRICFWNMQELNHDESSSGLPLTPNFEFEHTAGKPHWSISHPYHRNLWVCDESCEISMYL
jgi:WD40 repeat protein